MSEQRSRARGGRPRRSAPQALPDDLYDYSDDLAPSPRRRKPSPDAFDVKQLPVIDDWPERVPVTETEVNIFERYFGDVLDRLFSPNVADSTKESLSKLTTDVNSKP